MAKLTIDGREVEAAPGTLLIEAAKSAGIQIPHFCYHEALKPAGNCRICLVEVKMASGPPPKGPVIACMTPVAEGMDVKTQSQLAVSSRNSVMEFLLLNHPLDCPICDQAGECKLQRYSFEHGPGNSRLEEDKVKKPKNVRFSEAITFDAERCILCTRCVRFFEDVRGKNVLGLVNRGTFNEIAVASGKQIDDGYSLNIVDICPVGALTSTDFRFQSRVWFLAQTESVCNGCSTGCNISISARDDRIHRYVPRVNTAVNGHWMCDAGRMSYKAVASETRLQQPLRRIGGGLEPVDWTEALDVAAERIRDARKPVTFVASTAASNEDLWLFRRLASGVKGARLVRVGVTGEADGYLRTADHSPNSAGAELIGWGAVGLGDTGGGGLVVLGDHLDKAALPSGREFLVVLGWNRGTLADEADVVLPMAGFSEVDATYVNAKKRLQKAPSAVNPPGESLPGWKVLPSLEKRLGGGGVEAYAGPDDAFAAMKASVAAFGMVPARRIRRIDAMGIDLVNGRAV